MAIKKQKIIPQKNSVSSPPGQKNAKKLATRPQRRKFSPNEPDAKAILLNRR